jgi:hypothetical protein
LFVLLSIAVKVPLNGEPIGGACVPLVYRLPVVCWLGTRENTLVRIVPGT